MMRLQFKIEKSAVDYGYSRLTIKLAN